MDVLIISKWLTNYTGREAQAPSIISVMINMALNSGRFEEGQALIGSEATNKTISNVLLSKFLILLIYHSYRAGVLTLDAGSQAVDTAT